MMKPLLNLAAVGLVGFAAVKLVGFLLLPVLGMFIGLLMTALKIALIIALIYLGFHFFKKMTGQENKAEAQ